MRAAARPGPRGSWSQLGAVLVTAMVAGGCDGGSGRPDGGDGGADADAAPLEPLAEVPDPPTAEATDEARAAGFALYYRERVERVLTAYNRFGMFGDSTWATTIGKAAVARRGDELEVVPGPVDNNRIGTHAWMAWNAYRVFRSRPLELTLIRMFDGLAVYEAVTGHPGLTSRELYPGWTRVMDGVEGRVTRTRAGELVSPPVEGSPELELEVLDTFFDGLLVTYREDPAEFFFAFMPAHDVADYAITYGFSELPRFLRESDCCSSLMRTPEPHAWAGAFWGNHNSRDNFPDLILGLLAARAAAEDPDASEDVRAAARRAVDAGRRIGDLAVASGYALMTADERGPYDRLVVGGTIRPHGEAEAQDLGSLNVCSMAYLARAVSSEGLASPAPAFLLPGAGESLFSSMTFLVDCPVPAEGVTCDALGDAFCGLEWGTLHHLRVLDQPLWQLLEEEPHMASVFERAQNDFDDVAESMLALAHYARIVGDEALYREARASVFHLTTLMQWLAELIWPDDPAPRAEQRYQAALYQAQADLPVEPEDLAGLAPAEAQMAALEATLDLGDTDPAPLLTDEEIRAAVEAGLEGERDSVVERYRAEHGDVPPVRRAGEGYEARGAPLAEHPWAPVERPRHARLGGFRLLHAIPLCELAPHLLDCSWARLGCERPDLDGSGAVDEADRAAFDAARAAHEGAACAEGNAFCGGADLDRDGDVDASDAAFADAARGCRYDPP